MKTVGRLVFSVFVILGIAAAVSAQVPDARETFNLGVSAFRNAKFAQAAEYFTQAQRLDPTLSAADLYLATTYAQMFVPGNPGAENRDIGRKAIAT